MNTRSREYDLSYYNYYLPEELIAQEPLKERSSSRLLVLNKNSGEIKHDIFHNIINYLNKGDCLVLNDTRVIPARIFGEKEGSGGKIEFVLLRQASKEEEFLWEVILKPGRKAMPGAEFIFGGGILKAEIIEILDDGKRLVKFEYDGIFEQILDKIGVMPLPPYITKKLLDPERYQTVYSRYRGSAAAPTAGLHFSRELLGEIGSKGVRIAYITLHVGLGTFRPVRENNILKHKIHSEYYEINQNAADLINAAKRDGKRVICVGTTACRTVETAADDSFLVKASKGDTGIFIYPGYKFKMLDGLITNFHLPESTLIMLVSALAGRDNIMDAYKEAINEKYRFFSFGDAMLIL